MSKFKVSLNNNGLKIKNFGIKNFHNLINILKQKTVCEKIECFILLLRYENKQLLIITEYCYLFSVIITLSKALLNLVYSIPYIMLENLNFKLKYMLCFTKLI